MENILIQFATAGSSDSGGDLFSSLGIDWKLLILQSVAFLILLWILKKFVYPPLANMLDKREQDIRASADAAMEAEKHAAEAEARAAKLIDKAKRQAADIVTTARDDALQLTDDAHKKAEAKTESLLKSARDEIGREVESARKALQSETLELVAMASGKILDEKIDTKKDGELIRRAIKGAK